jgi:hypothetical protein
MKRIPETTSTYTDNLLIQSLSPTPNPNEVLGRLTYLPPVPRDVAKLPKHERLHHVMQVRDLHIPSAIECQLVQTIDLMIKQGYSYRDPRQAMTWTAISGEATAAGIRLPKSLSAAVEGLSGVGKTEACLRSLHALGPQVVAHESFPKLVGRHVQVVWLSVEVPPSGRASDLARSLMHAWHNATGGSRFDSALSKDRIDGMKALDEWRQVATSHFLGILHLDEIQNLFKIRSLKERKNRTESRLELSIVEDQVLRWFLNLTNTGQIPVIVSGTPDGIGALTKRLSTAQRINTAGYHRFDRFTDPTEGSFRNIFLPVLGRYQYVETPLRVDDALAKLIIDLTAGIPRIIIALWIGAHRVAFERRADDLRHADFTTAASTWLAPLQHAVKGIREGNAVAMSRYEDLTQADTNFWRSFWQQSTSASPTS